MSSNRFSEFHVGAIDSHQGPKIDVRLRRRGLMLALSSPSGAGKTTMTRKLLETDPDVILSISVTTRPRRPGEVDGRDYIFIDIPTFNRMRDSGELLENAKYMGNYYGTPKKPVIEALEAGKDVLFDIEWQGTQQLAEHAREDLVSVFILPPSGTELERRLRSRAQDTDEVIANRLEGAIHEISHYNEYDYVIINRVLEDSMLKLRTILGGERMRRTRLMGLSDLVKHLKDSL